MPAGSGIVHAELTAQSEATIRKLAHSDAMPILRREMRAATQPLVPAARQAARQTPSKRATKKARGGDVSLRRAVANSITRKMRLSGKVVQIAIIGVPKGGKANLGSVLEGIKPWDHPTYGHLPNVHQQSHPFFKKALEEHEPTVTRDIERVLDKFESTL